MNQTGVYGTGSLRQAFRNTESSSFWLTSVIFPHRRLLAGGGFSVKHHRDTPPQIHGTDPAACQHHAEPSGKEVS
jgi:hypothetical protein